MAKKISELTADTPAGGDELPVHDVSGGDTNKITINELLGVRSLTGGHGIATLGDLSVDRTVEVAPTDFAGDGLTTAGTPTQLAVGSGDGITINASDVRVNVSDLAGTGLEGDGSNNLRLASTAAGDGLKGGSGSALAVEPADFAGAGLEDDGADNARIASAAAGDGLTGGSGSALAIDFASANTWTANQTFAGKVLFTDAADAANSDQAARPIIHHGTGSASTVGIDGALHTEDV